MQKPQKIHSITLERLNRCLSPRRLGGYSRCMRLVSRHVGRPFSTVQGLRDFFSSMLEEEAAALLDLLEGRLPDLSRDTVTETRRFYASPA